MKKFNTSVTRSGPVTVDGIPVEVGGHTFTYSGHYTDRINLEGNRLVWEWYDIVQDDGRIIGRITPYVSDERIAALFARVFRDKDPIGFDISCRWPWRYPTEKVVREDGTVEEVEVTSPVYRKERTPVNVTIPADIIEETRLQLDDELRIEVYSIGPEPIALGRRLFHLSKTGKSFVIPLTKLSRMTKSRKYDGDSGSVFERLPKPGEYVALVVTYEKRTGRRELSDEARQTEDPDEELHDIADYVEVLADRSVHNSNWAIIEARERDLKDLWKGLDSAKEAIKTTAEDIGKLRISIFVDGDPDGTSAEMVKLYEGLRESSIEAVKEYTRKIDEFPPLTFQAEPKSPRTERWSDVVGEWIEFRKSVDGEIIPVVSNAALGIERRIEFEKESDEVGEISGNDDSDDMPA